MKQSPTEWLITDPFGIKTASPCQRAAARIMDGVPLGELAEDPDVVQFVGGPEALASLPTDPTEAPLEVVYLASIRSLKTITACAAAYRATQTVDVSGLGPGEIPRVSIVSLKLDTSSVAFTILRDTILTNANLKATLIGEPTADSLMVRHPSGRPIEIKCVAGAKAGAGLVARWSAGVIFDEAPRMAGRQDGVVNLDDARTAVLGRLLPGAQALYIGSAWAPFGTVYELVQQHWCKPSANMVVLRGTGPMLNPIWWTPERCARLEAQDPVAYQTDVMGEFADPESGLLSPIAVRQATREHPLELAPLPTAQYAAAVDPSEGGATGNAWTLVIVAIAHDQDDRTVFVVAFAKEWRGLRPEECWKDIAAQCRRYGLQEATTDQYAAAANADLARRYNLSLNVKPTTASSKVEDFTNLATLIHQGCVQLPPDRVMRRDLLSVKKRVTQSGVTIVLPRSSDGRHCDFAPALASAVRAARMELSAASYDPQFDRYLPEPSANELTPMSRDQWMYADSYYAAQGDVDRR